jgi:hypothetical protein
MKLANFAAHGPEYAGVALSRGGRLDGEIWAEFVGRWDDLRDAAAEIRARAGGGAGAVARPLIAGFGLSFVTTPVGGIGVPPHR